MATFVYPCERCSEYFGGKLYRVSSATNGEILLDMVVCYECYLEASQLGLDAQAIEIEQVALH
jgi:hypothetical protein